MPGSYCGAGHRASISPISTQWSEPGPHFLSEQQRLFPCREMAALVDLVEIDQVVITPLGPAARRLIDLAREDRDRGGQRDIDGIEVVRVVFPIDLRRRCRAVGQPVQRDVVEYLVARQRAL